MNDPWKSEGWKRAREAYEATRTPPRRSSGNNHAPKLELSNDELDTATVKIDDRNETDAEIKRLAKLTPIEYDRERKSAAEKLGIDRISVLDSAVKAARGEMPRQEGKGGRSSCRPLSRGRYPSMAPNF